MSRKVHTQTSHRPGRLRAIITNKGINKERGEWMEVRRTRVEAIDVVRGREQKPAFRGGYT
jgi:hypothetical protein